MTIQDKHYDFKKKLNKVDSQKYRNLLVPEIDWALNEAQELYVKLILQPKLKNVLGFQSTQRTLEDIYPLVKNDVCLPITDNLVEVPVDYWYYLKSYVDMTKDICENVKGKIFIRQHDDEFENSPFDKSSFEWKTVNAVYDGAGFKFFAEDFVINEFCVSYIKKLRVVHNAGDFRNGTYELPNGKVLGISTGAGKLVITSLPTTTGDINLTIIDGVDNVPLTINILSNSSEGTVINTIIEAINLEGTFTAFVSNTDSSEIDIVGSNPPIITLTFADTGVTGLAITTTANTSIGESSLDCELPDYTHREIVDLAVLLVTGELGNVSEYGVKQEKMKMNLNK